MTDACKVHEGEERQLLMTLYLVRHGEAHGASDDASRTLTKEGERNVRKVARFLFEAGISVSEIVHSGKTRARQTALLLAEQISPLKNATESEGLAPLAEPSPWRSALTQKVDDLMMVGHLPFLARLSSLLLCGNDGNFIDFSPGGVVCLVKTESGSWHFKWAIMPELLER